MEQSIKSKLSISIAFIVVLTVLLISILSNLIIKNEFTKYKEKQQLGKIEEIVNSIQDQYNIKENKWDEKNINNIGSEDKLIQNIVNNLKEEYVTKIEENDECFEIGAMVRLRDLEVHEGLNNYFNKISKELNTDIDCFSNKALSHFNTKNEWENYNWKEKFPTANFHLNVKANVVSGQMITKT